MKKLFLFCFLSIARISANGQSASAYADSLLLLLSASKADTTQIKLLSALSFVYVFSNPDSGLLVSKRELELANMLNLKKWEIDAKTNLGVSWWSVGDYVTSIKLILEALDYHKEEKDTGQMMTHYTLLGSVYRDQGDHLEALRYLRNADSLARAFFSCRGCAADSSITGSVYYEMKTYDSALAYLRAAERDGRGWSTLMLARTYEKLSEDSLALHYYHRCIQQLIESNNLKDVTGAYNSLAELFRKSRMSDSAFHYANRALDLAQKKRFNREILQSYLLLSNLYSELDTKKAFHFLNLALAAKDTLFSQAKQRQILSYKFNEELNQQELRNTRAQYRTSLKLYVLIAAVALFAFTSVILYRSNQHKQSAKSKIEQAYSELKSTQAQLIHSEKMASLGELTAGIAHEIQNPLNFVNNFSEINADLLEEMNQEIEKGNYNGARTIANDVSENQRKINHHGKRAEGIVKAMLQHSRSSSGVKELTDINTLLDEYLRLSYHGFRAKDKSFNVTLQTDFDSTVGKTAIIPQDIGRVLLNVISNAFYAVTEKQKHQIQNYEPTVSIMTRRDANKVLITVADNGTGIPQKFLDKIFQPFFSTKRTGEGTGLGLSLSYDIVKAHGGQLQVKTKEGMGSEFIIELPGT